MLNLFEGHSDNTVYCNTPGNKITGKKFTGKKINRTLFKNFFYFSLRSWVIFFLTMGAGTAFCAVLKGMSTSDVHVPLIFVLCVLIISLTTDGFIYGFLAALISVFEVNWAFTYPYMKLDFSIYGYPLTFLTLLAVGVAASMLSLHVKNKHILELETEKEKMRATLLRSVSHDLRTPLTAISGSISTVLENRQLTEEERRELLENAKNDSDWLYRMVENLLSVTKMSGDSDGRISKKEELLEEVLADAVSKFKARHSDVNIIIQPTEDIIFVPVDFMLIEQVLMNLLDNAVIHGKKTTAIRISAKNGSREVEVCVADNGEGIDPAIIDRLFDDAFETKAGMSGDRRRFMGIGLSVCKTIIEAHGGSITARNKTDGGAEFVFTLAKGENADEYQG